MSMNNRNVAGEPDMAEKGVWYLVQCKPRQDERAEEHLTRQGYECSRPVCRRERLVRGRRQELLESLFPGYLFISLSANDSWAPLRSTRGVSRVVSFGGKPLPVSEGLVLQLQSRAEVAFFSEFKTGQNVRIIEGQFSELDAIFMAMDGDDRVMLLLNILSRQRSITLPLGSVIAN